MHPSTLILALLLCSTLSFWLGRRRALFLAEGKIHRLHSLPGHYGYYTAIWCAAPALLAVAVWGLFESTVITHLVISALPEALRKLPADQLNLLINNIKNLAFGNMTPHEITPALQDAAGHYRHLHQISRAAQAVVVISLAIGCALLAWRSIHRQQRARHAVERTLMAFLIASSSIAIFTTIGILLSVLFEALRFFQAVAPADFIFGLKWSPQLAIRADQAGSSGAFGAVPLFAGTLLISLIAMLVAAPLGLLSAIYLSEYASRRIRNIAKPLLEILAGIPTVVYGFFAALMVAPLIRDSGSLLGLDVASESALAAGLVMGIMIIPFISSLADDVINAVPQALRDASFGLGATRSETIRRVVIPAALPGIVGGMLLGVSRAIGETMIVVMAAGLSANLTANPLQAVTTITVQIVTLLVGDQEFDSPKTLAAFALGLMLFVTTLLLNSIALRIVRRYREQYE